MEQKQGTQGHKEKPFRLFIYPCFNYTGPAALSIAPGAAVCMLHTYIIIQFNFSVQILLADIRSGSFTSKIVPRPILSHFDTVFCAVSIWFVWLRPFVEAVWRFICPCELSFGISVVQSYRYN